MEEDEQQKRRKRRPALPPPPHFPPAPVAAERRRRPRRGGLLLRGHLGVTPDRTKSHYFTNPSSRQSSPLNPFRQHFQHHSLLPPLLFPLLSKESHVVAVLRRWRFPALAPPSSPLFFRFPRSCPVCRIKSRDGAEGRPTTVVIPVSATPAAMDRSIGFVRSRLSGLVAGFVRSFVGSTRSN